jgi:hypothetical protein
MAKSSKKELETKAAYNKIPSVMHKRVENNKVRREAIREGKAHVGDGTAVDHIKPLANGGSNSDANTRLIDADRNKGWRKGQKGYKVGKV